MNLKYIDHDDMYNYVMESCKIPTIQGGGGWGVGARSNQNTKKRRKLKL